MNEEEEEEGEVNKHRGDSTSSSHDYCESPPAAVPLPRDVDDDDDEQHDDEFEFSPASPPLTQTTKGGGVGREDDTADVIRVARLNRRTDAGRGFRSDTRPARQPTGALYKGGESGTLHKLHPRKPHEHRGV